MQTKLSAIIKDMAGVVMKDPVRIPSSEAAHAALLFAHIAWNRAIGAGAPEVAFTGVLDAFEASSPSLWDELTSDDPETLIAQLVSHKQTHYPYDRRNLIVCGMIGDNVHVEWTDATPN